MNPQYRFAIELERHACGIAVTIRRDEVGFAVIQHHPVLKYVRGAGGNIGDARRKQNRLLRVALLLRFLREHGGGE